MARKRKYIPLSSEATTTRTISFNITGEEIDKEIESSKPVDDWNKWEDFTPVRLNKTSFNTDEIPAEFLRDDEGKRPMARPADYLEHGATYNIGGIKMRATFVSGRWRMERPIPDAKGQTHYPILPDGRIFSDDGICLGNVADIELVTPSKPSKKEGKVITVPPPAVIRQRTRISEQQRTILMLLDAQRGLSLSVLTRAVYNLNNDKPTTSQRTAISRSLRRLCECGYIYKRRNDYTISFSGKDLIKHLLTNK